MQGRSTIIAIVAAFAIVACASPPPDAARNASPTKVARPVPVREDAEGRQRRIPLAERLPVDAQQVLAFGDRGRLDLSASVLDSGRSGFRLVYESGSDGDLTTVELRQARSRDGVSIGPGAALPVTRLAVAATPSLVRANGRTWLYLIAAETLEQAPKFLRVDLTDPARPTTLELPIASFMRTTSWPRVVVDGTGRIAVAFRDRSGRPCVAYSRDGVVFDAPRPLDEARAAMVGITPMTGGGWLLSYQQMDDRDATRMKTLFRVSADGESWSAAVRVADANLDVHDAHGLARADRGADLYYIHRPDATSIAVYRRAVFADATLGPEQQLTASSLGEALKPTAHRLQDGRVLVTYGAVTAHDSVGGYPSAQQLTMFRLTDDAPASPRSH